MVKFRDIVSKDKVSGFEKKARLDMENKKHQTTIEWLVDWMGKNQYFIGNDLLKAVEQAKQMEMEKMKSIYNDGVTNGLSFSPDNFEQYYNKTYSPSSHGGETMTTNNNPDNPGTDTTVTTNSKPTSTTGWKGETTIDKLELETLMIMYLDGIEFYGTDSEWVEARTVFESFMRYINTLGYKD